MLFSELSQYFQKLEATSSRNTMTEILSDLFRQTGKGEIDKICYLLQGRVVPRYEAVEFGVADKFIIRAIAQAYSKSEDEVRRENRKSGDLGNVAQQLHHGHGKELTVTEVFEKLVAVAHTGGSGSQEKKISLLSDLLQEVNALSARYIVRIPLGKLRLGFSDMTILDALSWMLTQDKSHREKLEESYNVRPDIGFITKTVKERGIEGLKDVRAQVGAPILAALCQRLPDAAEMIKKMGKIDVEPKYDGVRAQIHYEKAGKEVNGRVVHAQSFSRNLENTTDMFPELTHISSQLNSHEVILDSEAVGVDTKTGRLIPFQETMTRKRKHGIEEKSLTLPLKFFVFDILYLDGKDLLSLPLWERRKLLESTVKTGDILIVSPHIVTESVDELLRYHDEQIDKGLEGAVVKKWDSPYEPGRRGYNWVKFKESGGNVGKLTDTIDAVVMGYYRGRGKRANFGIGAFLVGVRSRDSFVTITKIGTGVSDELWHTLRVLLNKSKATEMPKEYKDVNKLFIPDVWIEPKIVVELAGDDLTKSSTHGAGVAVRFPRLVRIRDDKSPEDATSVSEITDMYKNQGNGSNHE